MSTESEALFLNLVLIELESSPNNGLAQSNSKIDGTKSLRKGSSKYQNCDAGETQPDPITVNRFIFQINRIISIGPPAICYTE